MRFLNLYICVFIAICAVTAVSCEDSSHDDRGLEIANLKKDVDLLRSILEEHGIQLNIQKGTLGDVQCTLSGHEAKLTEHDTALADIQVDDRLEELSVIADQLMNATTQASAGGAVYTRWGRSVCGVGARLVYTGLMGNNDYANTGGGHNFQCLPHNPQYVNYVDGYQYSAEGRGLVMGTEYHGDPDSIFDKDNLDDSTFIYNNVPCSVCHVENQTSVIMIPAQTQCELSWTEQYWGYLVSEDNSGAAPSTFECVDHAPEAASSGSASELGARIYNVEGYCSNLPCPSYTAGWELTCVVCSK